MEILFVAVASLAGGALTLYSGFGLGTVLLAVMLLFFPPGVAVAVTAVVHFLNNVFKFGLLGRHADAGVVLAFGLPAIAGAWLGAETLLRLAGSAPLFSYEFAGVERAVTPVKLVIGSLLAAFALVEFRAPGRLPQLNRRWLPAGGALSGFFGGLSGHQGALRSLFLVKAGLSRESFIATGVVIALLIDITRLATYFAHFRTFDWRENALLLGAASAAAFAGSFAAAQLLPRITLHNVQRIVATLLAIVSAGLIAGLL